MAKITGVGGIFFKARNPKPHGLLKKNGVKVQQGSESHENGAFAWSLDHEGNRLEPSVTDKVVVPGEKRPTRWIRQVASFTIDRAPEEARGDESRRPSPP